MKLFVSTLFVSLSFVALPALASDGTSQPAAAPVYYLKTTCPTSTQYNNNYVSGQHIGAAENIALVSSSPGEPNFTSDCEKHTLSELVQFSNPGLTPLLASISDQKQGTNITPLTFGGSEINYIPSFYLWGFDCDNNLTYNESKDVFYICKSATNGKELDGVVNVRTGTGVLTNPDCVPCTIQAVFKV